MRPLTVFFSRFAAKTVRRVPNFGCGSRKDVNGIGRGSESEGYLKGEGLTWVICSHMVIISPSAHS